MTRSAGPSLALLLLCLGENRPVGGQVLSCQAAFGDRGATLEFARRSADVSAALADTVGTCNDVVAFLERCLSAEVAASPDLESCRRASSRLPDARTALSALETAIDRLQAVHRQDRTLPLYDDALARILADAHGSMARVRPSGHRFGFMKADSASDPRDPRGLAEILQFQREDLASVRKSFDAAAEAFRSSLPAAESGKLAAAVYSERSPLLSRMLAATEQLETYRRFHFDTCRATVAAMQQIYPAGLHWIEEPASDRHPSP